MGTKGVEEFTDVVIELFTTLGKTGIISIESIVFAPGTLSIVCEENAHHNSKQ